MTTLLPGETLAASLADQITVTQQKIQAAQAAGDDIRPEWIIRTLNLPLKSAELRRAIFELVRRVPYRLGSWNNAPMSLFQQGAGDCRHKASAAAELMQYAGETARKTLLRFNWADLPVPGTILSLLPDTRGFHDTVEFSLNGEMHFMDATWDMALRSANFPVMPVWDGLSDTWQVTLGGPSAVQQVVMPVEGQDIYSANQMNWPQRDKTMVFNQALNDWMDEIRRNRDDRCIIIHTDRESTKLSLRECLGQLA